MKNRDTYCPLHARQFKSHMGLVVHYWRSYDHASPERKAEMDKKRKRPKEHEFKRPNHSCQKGERDLFFTEYIKQIKRVGIEIEY